MDSLYIVMPAYNEEENIEAVIKQWYSILERMSDKSRLVVADSGSTDATHTILEKLKKEYPRLEILTGTEKGHGPKVMALYKYAIAAGADYLFQTDSDGQTDPNEFESFWTMRADYDAILGLRRVRGDGKGRAFVEHVVCFLLKIYFRVSIPDANAPFRLMKASLVEKYIGRLPEDYNLPNIMMTTFFVYYKEKFAFKEVTFRPRQGGVNSVNIVKIVKIGWKALGDFRFFKKELNTAD